MREKPNYATKLLAILLVCTLILSGCGSFVDKAVDDGAEGLPSSIVPSATAKPGTAPWTKATASSTAQPPTTKPSMTPQASASPDTGESQRTETPSPSPVATQSPPSAEEPAATPSPSAKPGAKPSATTTSSATPKPSGTPKPSAVPKQGKLVALTFDDGPDAKYTPQILNILKEHNVKATFFVVGIQVKAFPSMLKLIADEGHMIGNHSWDHKKLTQLSNAAVQKEIAQTNASIDKILGEPTAWFRAPYGALNSQVSKVIEQSGSTHVGWTVDTKDWAGSTPSQMLETTKRQLKPGGIILMHNFGGKGGNLDNTVAFLPELIEYLQDQGYTLVTIPELYNARK